MMTWKGTVVYKRPKNPFSYKDIARICKKVQVQETPESALEEVIPILNAIMHLIWDLNTAIKMIPLDLLDMTIAWVLLETGSRVLTGILEWVRKQLTPREPGWLERLGG